MKHLLLCVALVALVLPAWAEPAAVTVETLAPLPGADVMITGEGPAQVIPTPEAQSAPLEGADSPDQVNVVCKTVSSMPAVPGPDYVAGVDAYGRAVAPADVGGAPVIAMPEQVDIPISINVAQSMNLLPATEMNVTPGVVRVFKDGRVLYNNQDVTTQISAFCNQPLQPELNVNVQE